MGKRERRQRREKPAAKALAARAWRVSRKVAAVVLAVIGAFVLLSQAFAPARDAASWISNQLHPDKPPTHAEATVASYVAFTRRALPWVGQPTIYEPSADVMVKEFGRFDPYTLHRYAVGGTKQRTDIGFLAEHSPQFAGVPVTIEGAFLTSSVVEDRGRIASWQLQLRDPEFPHVGLVCRMPAHAARGPRFHPHDWVLAQGLLLADGAVQRVDGRGMDRILYVACSAATKRQVILSLTSQGQFFAVPGDTPAPTGWIEAHPRAAIRLARKG